MKKPKWSTSKKIAVGVAGFVLLFSLVSLLVVDIIHRRQFPRVPRPDSTVTLGLRHGDLAAAYPRERMDFYSGENRLTGHVYGMDQDRGLLVVVHGLGGGADSYLSQITYFVDQGWRVFAYDATGSFDSEGASTKGFPQALLDLDAALTHLRSQEAFAGLPVLLYGHSWGGYAVANALHLDHEIAGVVSLSGANSAMDILVEQGGRMLGGFIHTQVPYLWLHQRMKFGEAAFLNAADAIRGSDVPVLVIHGTADDFITYNGSAIMARKEAFLRPQVRTLSLEEPGRNGHDNLFRSQEALDYIDALNVEYRALYEEHAQDIPYGVRQEFYAQVDRVLANAVHEELMEEVHGFFLESIGE